MRVMAEMIRKQVYIEPRQERLLKERAKRYRVTEAELIRRAIDQALERRIARPRKTAGPGSIRSWTRDELYDR
jgi:hypothetical protein